MSITSTTYLIRQWGREKGIIGPEGSATQLSQFSKLLEEANEFLAAYADGNQDEKVDAIGDCGVVLILLSELIGVPFEDCLESAYQVIKNRTGSMQNGQFVKD
jgi:NTP pyrophosphatase (non-canonical NTP hydrolase)